MTSPTVDPIGRPIDGPWLRSADGTRAVVELAGASGLSRLGRTSAIRWAPRPSAPACCCGPSWTRAPRRIVLGIGGSATTDGGAGILDALGGWVEPAADRPGRPRHPAGRPRPARRLRRDQPAPRPDRARRPPTVPRRAPARPTSRRSTSGSPAMPTCSRRPAAGASATRPGPARPAGSASACSA